jgi:transposase InsO family protein
LITQSTVDNNISPRYLAGSIRQQEHRRSNNIIRYIEGFYNSRRRHSALGYRRPNEVHYGYQQQALAA